MRLSLWRCVLLVLAAGAASAAPIVDDFFGSIETEPGYPGLITGGGSGWSDGLWIRYDQAPTGPWWNQWYYDHPPAPGGKHIDLDLTITGDIEPAFVEVAVNFSTPDYSNPNMPPMPDQEQFITRGTVFSDIVLGSEPVTITASIDIERYNPEWVSIDIRATVPPTGGLLSIINFQGTIAHECFAETVIPEPATVALLALGLAAIGGRRRGRRR